MKIRWLVGKHEGNVADVPQKDNTIAVLIAAGIAEEVPANAESIIPGLLAASGSHHVQPPFSPTVVWGVRPLPYGADGRPCVVRHHCSEFTWYDGPPKEAPEEIVERFMQELKGWQAKLKASEAERARAERSRA